MQRVSQTYERIYMSRNYYMETCVIIGLEGDLITEKAERILFGGYAIRVAGGTPEMGYHENMLISVKTTRRVFANNLPEVGCCPCGEIYIEMHMPKGEFPRKAEIIPYIRLVSTDDGSTSEWIRKGIFFIDSRDNSHNDDHLDILSLHGYDAMIKANVDYGEFYDEVEYTVMNSSDTDWIRRNDGKYYATLSNSKITSEKDATIEYEGDESIAFSSNVTYTCSIGQVVLCSTAFPPPNLFVKMVIRDKNTLKFPATDLDVVYDIATKMGVDLDPDSVFVDEHKKPLPPGQQPYINHGYQVQYPSENTMREVLGYIGAMYGGNWVMNDIGDLQFVPLWALPPETSLITNELGYRITFGHDPQGDPYRISIVRTNR